MIVDKLSGSRVHFEVTVTKTLFEHSLDHAFQEVIKKVEIKGFRKGKAPRTVYEARFGVESLYEEAIKHALQESYYEAVIENNIEVVSQPKIDLDVASVRRGEDFTYKVTVAVKPEVQLGEYLNLEVKALPETVTEAELGLRIDQERERNAEMVLKENGALENNDTAVFDFLGTIDGVPFEGGSAENHELVIGSGGFIPGFEDQMIGMTPESTKDVKVTFPKDYHEQSLAGKEAVFKVTLHEIKTRVVPELTDDFVKELGIENVSTVKEYQTYLKTDMDRQKQIQSKNHILKSVIEAATEKASFEIPEEMIKEEASRLDDQNRRQIKQYNLDFKIYLQYLGKTEEDYLRELEMQAEKTLRQQLVIEAIAKKEKLEATKDEIEKKYQEISEQYSSQNITVEQVRQAIPESAIIEEITHKKAVDLLVEKANIIRE
ncbi:MAG: trigger factor [Acholeplasmataceae bacterium]|nr:trigger factor [Acholeplasmataceae bacterium]